MICFFSCPPARWLGCIFVSFALLIGCSGVHQVNTVVEPQIGEAKVPEPPTRSAETFAGDGWWDSFRDSQLERYTEEALSQNLELRALGSRIDQANAFLRQANSDLFPRVAFDGEYQNLWRDQRTDSTSLGLLLDWEIDVWGRLRSRSGSARKTRDATIEDWLGGRLLLSSVVAEVYFDVLEQYQQLQLVNDQIELNETLLELTEFRFGQGQAGSVDVLQQQQQLEATQARKPLIEGQLAQVKLSLNVLLGEQPGNELKMKPRNLAYPPSLPEVGVSSDLLVNRPDLRAFQAQIVALDYDVGEAVADRFPRFSISAAGAATGPTGLDTLVADASANLLGPVFEAGFRKAEVSRRRARLEEELSSYSHAFLQAVQEVESALVLEQKQRESLAIQEKQLQTANKLLREARNRYSQGLTDYLPVLDALTTVQDLERTVISSRRLLISYRVALHRALGGPMPQKEDS